MVVKYLVHRVLFMSYFTVVLCGLVFCTWRLARNLISVNKPRPNSPIPGNPAQMMDSKLIKRNMILSLVSSVSFSTAMLLAYISTGIIYFHTGWDNTSHKEDTEANSLSLIRILTIIVLFLDLFGYLSLFVFYFIRMRLTFVRSQYRLSDQWVRMIKLLTMISLFIVGVSIVLYLVLDRRWISAWVGVFPALIYCGASVWIGSRFLYLTRRIAHNAPPGTGLNLLTVSLKMTIVTNAAIAFTLLTGLVWLIRIWTGDGYWIRQLFYYMFITDPVTSMFSLLFTFKSEHWMYRMIYGRINDYFLNLLVGPSSGQS